MSAKKCQEESFWLLKTLNFDTLKRMKKRLELLPFFILSILSLAGFFSLVIFMDPQQSFIIQGFEIPSVIVFFVLLFIVVAGLISFIFVNLIHGVLLGIFLVSFLTLQYFHYNNLFYIAVLLVITILLEFLFWKKK